MMINKIFSLDQGEYAHTIHFDNLIAKFNIKYLKKLQVFKVPESFSNIGLSGYENIFNKINNLNS